MSAPYFTSDRATLYLGDCLDVMRTMPDASVDAVVCDPPYTAAGASTNGRTGGADTQFFAHWLRAVLAEVRRVTKPSGCAFLFCDWRTVGVLAQAMTPAGDRQTAQVWTISQALVWDRESIGLGSPFRNAYEMIAFARGPEYVSTLPKNIPTVIRHRWTYGAHPHHGAEKPVSLCRKLVDWALPNGGTLLDPFMGSGSVGVAAALAGLRCSVRYIGIELEAGYAATAEKRIGHPVSAQIESGIAGLVMHNEDMDGAA